MRQQFLQVLRSPETNDEMTDVVRRFWTRAKPLARPLPPSSDDAQVIDLATWARTHRFAR